MLFLLRCTERGKEPHAGKNKLRNDIADCLRASVPGARLTFDVGRIYVEADRDITAELAQLHGVSSFSPCSVCEVDDMERHVLAVAPAALAGKRSFRVKIRRIGTHPFRSSAKAAELGAKILASVPGVVVDLRAPDVELSIEVRDRTCHVCTEIHPGLDARRAAQPSDPPKKSEVDGAPRFLVDAMLGTLASRLRALGFDTAWRRDTADSLLLREARAEGRYVLTQDRELAEIGGPAAHFVHGKTAAEQLADVIERFALSPSPDQLFTRCSLCNAVLVPIEKAAVATRVPPGALAAHDAFWTCRACDKIYWKGSHYDEMFETLYGKKPAR